MAMCVQTVLQDARDNPNKYESDQLQCWSKRKKFYMDPFISADACRMQLKNK